LRVAAVVDLWRQRWARVKQAGSVQKELAGIGSGGGGEGRNVDEW